MKNQETEHTRGIDAVLARMGLELTDEGREYYIKYLLDGEDAIKPSTLLRKINQSTRPQPLSRASQFPR